MPIRILIADDNEILRDRLAELILEDHDGWEVCAAVENGQDAVEKAEELKPDLLVLDLAMPVMNGLEAARRIGRITPSVPILIYTLHNSSWVELEAKKAGARKVVFKPDVDALLKTIEDYIEKKTYEVPSAPAPKPEAAWAQAAQAPAMAIEPAAAVNEVSSETGEAETPLAASGEADTTPLT